MKKDLSKNVIEMALLMILLSMLAFDTVLLNVNAETPATTVSVVPSSQVVGEEDKLLPESFTINVTVTNVTDLYAWQTTIWYSPRILRVTDVTKANATGHVFEGKDPIYLEPLIETWTKTLANETTVDFSNPIDTTWLGEQEGPEARVVKRHYNITGWLDLDASGTLTTLDMIFVEPNLPIYVEYYYVDRIAWEISTTTNITTVRLDISMAYVTCGAVLLDYTDTFSGNGTFCQITFDAIRPGNSVLNFSTPAGSHLLDSSIPPVDIPCEFADGNVRVRGIPAVKDPSEITIDVNPSSVNVGVNVRISGMIVPSRSGVNVTIEYMPEGDTWTELATVVTDSIGNYCYIWNATETGTYKFRASWEGDALYEGDVTETKTVSVEGDNTPPVIEYVFQQPPPGSVYPGDTVEVYAIVTDDLSGVKHVILNYTASNEEHFIVNMTELEENVYNATIPPFPCDTNVTYVIIAEDNVNNTITTEEKGYEREYHVIPEFPSTIILSIAMVFTALAVIIAKRRLLKKHQYPMSSHSNQSI